MFQHFGGSHCHHIRGEWLGAGGRWFGKVKHCVGYVEHFEGDLLITAREIGKRGQDFPEPMGDKIPKNRPFFRAGPAWYVEVT